MHSAWPCTVLVYAALAVTAGAQAPKNHFTDQVFAAKTVAIVDDTRSPGVQKGAVDALQSWGQFKVVDDPQLADITLRFEKNRTHEGRDTQKADPDGKNTSYNYSLSFSSSIHMTATLRDSDTPFYTTTTDDSKAKAGSSCVNNLHTAYRDAHQPSKP